jgi:hypothetical protein
MIPNKALCLCLSLSVSLSLSVQESWKGLDSSINGYPNICGAWTRGANLEHRLLPGREGSLPGVEAGTNARES